MGDPEAETLGNIFLENMTTRKGVRPASQRRLAGMDPESSYRRVEPGVQVREKEARAPGPGNGQAEAPHVQVPDGLWLGPSHRP